MDVLHHLRDVVAFDLMEFPFLYLGKRHFGCAREVGQDSDNKWQFALFSSVAGLHVVGDVHPMSAVPSDWFSFSILIYDAFGRPPVCCPRSVRDEASSEATARGVCSRH